MIELIDTVPGHQRRSRPSTSGCWDTRATGSSAIGRASWSIGRATGTRGTAGRGCTPARPTAWRLPTASVTLEWRPVHQPAAVEDAARSATRTAPSSSPSSAGPELEAEAQKLWRDGKPDEYFFLEVYGSAVVEHLVTMTGARLCAWAESAAHGRAAALQPGLSRVGDRRAAAAARSHQSARGSRCRPSRSKCSSRACCGPKKSLLAVFGVTRHVDRVRRLTDLIPCENCSFLTVPVPARARTGGRRSRRTRSSSALGRRATRGSGRAARR